MLGKDAAGAGVSVGFCETAAGFLSDEFNHANP